MDKECTSEDPICSKLVTNTRGCSSKLYIIWLKDKNGSAHHLSGDSTKYQWNEFANGDVELSAEGLSASGLSGTFDVKIKYTGKTATAPTNSPKYSNCFSLGSVSGWNYYTSTTGSITSINYSTTSVCRKGPSAQIGEGANITQNGYGASGWFNISGGSVYFPNVDFNVLLRGRLIPAIETKVCANDTLNLCIDDLVNLDSILGEDVTVQASSSTSRGASVTVEVRSYTSGVDCCNGDKPNAITYQYVSSNKIDNSQTNSSVSTNSAPNGRKALIIVSGSSIDLNLPTGVMYCRVKQIDFDLKFDYTEIEVIQVTTKRQILVYPNPARNEINVQVNGSNRESITITNLTGQVLDKTNLSQNGFATLNAHDYPNGIYFIKVESQLHSDVSKVIIQK